MSKRRFVLFCSWGNDSVALVQLMAECGLASRCYVVYTNTGWAADYWPERVQRGSAWATTLGFECVEIGTVGFEELCRGESDGGRFPSGRMKFCTRNLKILPAVKWLNSVDPNGNLICVVGKRRAESQARANAPAAIPDSANHGGRFLWHPLVEFSDESRNLMVLKTPLELLPHRSDECEPCIFSSRADLRRVSRHKVDTIRAMENDIGRVMFRPRAYAGAKGIDEVMKWAWSERGQYRPPDLDTSYTDERTDGDIDDGGCETGMCGG